MQLAASRVSKGYAPATVLTTVQHGRTPDNAWPLPMQPAGAPPGWIWCGDDWGWIGPNGEWYDGTATDPPWGEVGVAPVAQASNPLAAQNERTNESNPLVQLAKNAGVLDKVMPPPPNVDNVTPASLMAYLGAAVKPSAAAAATPERAALSASQFGNSSVRTSASVASGRTTTSTALQQLTASPASRRTLYLVLALVALGAGYYVYRSRRRAH